ncbi:preprotein translocase subunit SecA [candidate division WOR-1 bacterium DG_54_3]|uniref:Protein translocase subunit SecA n=1 Tax=candidate division WOR-1 bacterium DG_54_3 TaxID=1703775 RepID=A0A0S7Y5K9_UNCSA|nr:MAG: preprotein translocase subunit SecA [candidate division WOR-1 bacterium DG_54_3]
MYKWLIQKIFGTKNERDLKRLQPYVVAINEQEPSVQKLSNDQLRAKTNEFKEKIDQGASLDDLLIEAFAVVREVARRTINMRHFDVQLMGGVVLHQGKIAEMKTGEGKTLVATLPTYLNALEGKGVHIVTVNDYLAKRDTEWMGPIYKFLGLKVGTIQHEIPDYERKEAYRSDVTYGTNNEFGFDYLRDNMKFRLSDLVQREHRYAIVDEVDSILIDEARTPLIISGPTEESTAIYYKVDNLIRRLQKNQHFQVEEKTRTVALNEEGVSQSEKFLNVGNLYDLSHMDLIHAINQGLKAHHLFKKDVDYMVKEGKVIIVDEFTGRLMPGRRYSDGLHQALEAKEKVRIEEEYQTLASVTFQNYFRMYGKLAGMTGTAVTEATEFQSIYDLDVVEIPTNKTLVRHEYSDVVYRTAKEKWDAACNEITELNEKGRPVLVGTISIENSEYLSSVLRKRGIDHVVLNAKYHEMEAKIIAQAGRVGAVTIATNMAGRGVDILLGGNPEYLAREDLKKKGIDPENNHQEQWEHALTEAKRITALEHNTVVDTGGLHILGTERHEARRIDNQLRGRAGRQGDPGSSRFYLSLEDDLMRIFGSDRISGLMARIGMEEGTPIEHKMVSKAIERAQRQVEGQNFTIRKHLLEYDDVMNKQRETVYNLRKDILHGKNLKEHIFELIETIADWLMENSTPKEKSPEDWDSEGYQNAIGAQFGVDVGEWGIDWDTIHFDELREKTLQTLTHIYQEKEDIIGTERMREFERIIMLQIIDSQWKDHLLGMDYLKEGIGLRGYGQRDPLVEYKKESYDMFQAMMDRIEDETTRYLFLLQPIVEEKLPERKEQPLYYQRPQEGQVQTSRKARSVIPKKRKKKKKRR